jgi:hypothetical protein
VSVAAFITCQRTDHEVPHALACRALNVSQSWYYKWRGRASTARDQRRSRLAGRIAEIFVASGGTYGSPAGGCGLRRGFSNRVSYGAGR